MAAITQRVWDLRWPASVWAAAAAVGFLVFESDAGVASRLALLLAVGITFSAFIVIMTLRHWWFGFVAFIGWLPFEDLTRKFLGNDLRIYALKDLLFALAVVAALRHLRNVHAWHRAFQGVRGPLYLLIAWAAVRAISSDAPPQIALVGFRLDFIYVPLVAVGFLFGTNERWARRLLHGICALTAVVLAFGILQAVNGPGFLNPESAPEYLNLKGHRDVPTASGAEVLAPTGTFVDAGRYGQLVLMSIAMVAAAGLLPKRTRNNRVLVFAGLTTMLAVWAASSRGALAMSAVVIALGLGLSPGFTPARFVRRVVAIGAVAFCSVLLASYAFPDSFATTQEWFSESLNPVHEGNQYAFRWDSYSGGTVAGLREGGLIGDGTGTQSIGQQYFSEGGVRRGPSIEAGYGQIAGEWGWIGLGIWVVWIVVWLRTLYRATRRAPAGWGGAATVLSAWIFTVLVLQFFAGLQYLQNYYINAYLWLVAGLVFGLGAPRDDEADQPASTSATGSLYAVR